MVCIYGTLHSLQTSVVLCYPNVELANLTQARLHFAADVINILAEHPKMSVVAEEAMMHWPSIAQECALFGSRSYVSVEIPGAERNRCGVPSTANLTAELNPQLLGILKAKNAYMFKRVMEWLPDAGDALVICGAHHVTSLTKLFEAGGVETESVSITERSWCRDEYLGQTIASLREEAVTLNAAYEAWILSQNP